MKKVLRLRVAACAVFLLCMATAIGASAQTFTTLFRFDGSNGANPYLESLVQGFDGSFYGTNNLAGTYGGGTVFKITAGGTLTTLYNFCAQKNCADGGLPIAGLAQGTDGSLYGTTSTGGAGEIGTVFKITPEGTLTTLHRFDGSDGTNPSGALAEGADGSFYGTTNTGGVSNAGTIFRITPQGALTTLYSFCAVDCSSGGLPAARLIQGKDGNFYVTTNLYGANGDGTVFKITPSGVLTTLYRFCAEVNCSDGGYPFGGLIQAADGNFYGTTQGGVTSVSYGTVFKITPSGVLTTLYSFCAKANCGDGAYPDAGLVQAGDGDFYGTTSGGGAKAWGTVFRMTPRGVLTTLYSFCAQTNCHDGTIPFGLFQALSMGQRMRGAHATPNVPLGVVAARYSASQWGSARSWKRCQPSANQGQRSSSSATASQAQQVSPSMARRRRSPWFPRLKSRRPFRPARPAARFR